jgi:uncharacterized protein (UPF0276 family)
MSETDFLHEVVKQTNCGLLLDINNVYVSANNQHYSPEEYINHYPLHAVGEIHLAGHTRDVIDNEVVLIDDHGSPVIDDVWALFSYALQKMTDNNLLSPPALIEWDTDIPELSVLVNEADKARKIQKTTTQNSAKGNDNYRGTLE